MSEPTATSQVEGSVAQKVEIIAATPPTSIDPAALASCDEERLQLENERLRVEVNTLEQDRDERKLYANRLFCLVVWWLILDSAVILLCAMGTFGPFFFVLSDAVIIAILTTSTATVISLLAIVTRYLFPHRRP